MDGFRSRGVRALVAGAAALAAVGGTVGPARAAPAPWRLPIDGGLARPFVEPASRFGSGHRGIDLVATPGAPVRASGRGNLSRTS